MNSETAVIGSERFVEIKSLLDIVRTVRSRIRHVNFTNTLPEFTASLSRKTNTHLTFCTPSFDLPAVIIMPSRYQCLSLVDKCGASHFSRWLSGVNQSKPVYRARFF